jgi:hypothetical protein
MYSKASAMIRSVGNVSPVTAAPLAMACQDLGTNPSQRLCDFFSDKKPAQISNEDRRHLIRRHHPLHSHASPALGPCLHLVVGAFNFHVMHPGSRSGAHLVMLSSSAADPITIQLRVSLSAPKQLLVLQKDSFWARTRRPVAD